MRYILLATVAVIACGPKQPPRRAGEEYLNAIEVHGNAELSDKQLVSGLALKRQQRRSRPPDPYLVQVDEDRIRGEYLRKGFFSVDVRGRIERRGDAANVIYAVDEGARATTRVVIEGLPDDPDLPLEKVREALPLRDGEPFDYAAYEAAKPRLLGVVIDAGYARARLDPIVWADRANREAIVELAYDVGPKCKFGKIEVTGVSGDLQDAVRERLQFATGSQYSMSAISASQRRLYAMQRFSTVQMQPDQNADSSVVDVTIAVSQAARHEIKLGGGVGVDPTAYEIRGRAGYSIAGFPTDMDTSSLELRPAYGYLRTESGWEPRARALARIERQDVFWTYAKAELQAGYNYLALEPYTSYGPRAKVGFSTPLGFDRLQLRLAWGIDRIDFRNISPLLGEDLVMRLRLDDTSRIGAYQQTISIDLRDNPIQTQQGLYGEVRVLEGTPYAGGELAYLQLIPELRGFVPLPVGGIVLASRARAGAFYGAVPVTERFVSGGASNHRGFGERELSPFVRGEVDGKERTVPYGGSAFVETGVEARVPITTWRKMLLGTVVFLDGGDVTDQRDQLALGNLHWAAGVGLRLDTIVGPVRADLGYRLNRHGPLEPAPGQRFAFHFSIGEAF